VATIVKVFFTPALKKAIINQKAFHKTDKKTWVDISKAKDLLDWQPSLALDIGLKNTVDWYLEKKDWVDNLKL
jgi:UDP-glucuronate 4-epimerase